jgi:CRP-like cAMP-binding protein
LARVAKINILKSVNIFLDTPTELLAEVADLLQDIEVDANETIFHKGELGTSMYVVVDGRVRVHDGEMTINDLTTRDVFGEMAAIDPEPRSASVTATTHTRLFRLDQESFRELMRSSPVIMERVIQILSDRLRARVKEMAEDYEYLRQFERVTAAAAAVEAGVYIPESLDEVARRTDALGQLARVFQRMVREVYAREENLKRQVAELRIEIDEVKKAQQVAEITDTDYFQQLQQKANRLRNRPAGTPSS